jgi:hypothetical protein
MENKEIKIMRIEEIGTELFKAGEEKLEKFLFKVYTSISNEEDRKKVINCMPDLCSLINAVTFSLTLEEQSIFFSIHNTDSEEIVEKKSIALREFINTIADLLDIEINIKNIEI